jgi:hypothetical protein
MNGGVVFALILFFATANGIVGWYLGRRPSALHYSHDQKSDDNVFASWRNFFVAALSESTEIRRKKSNAMGSDFP